MTNRHELRLPREPQARLLPESEASLIRMGGVLAYSGTNAVRVFVRTTSFYFVVIVTRASVIDPVWEGAACWRPPCGWVACV